MKPILITGANGFSGRHLLALLGESGIDTLPMVRTACGLENEVVADFCDDNFPALLRKLPPVSAVVHLGTRVGWDGCQREELFKPNILATAQLADWAKTYNSYFIFASAAVIAGEHTPHITGDTGFDLNTSNNYLYSKWLGEQVIAMSGIRHLNLRISGIFGRNGPRHLGLNNAIRDARNGSPPAQYGEGKIKRNYIYVKDLCIAIQYCLANQLEGTLLAAGTYKNSLAEILETLCDVLLPGSEPEKCPGGGGHDQIIDSSPLLPTTRTFKEAIEDIK